MIVIHCFSNLGVCLLDSVDSGMFLQEVEKTSLITEIMKNQVLDLVLIKIKKEVG